MAKKPYDPLAELHQILNPPQNRFERFVTDIAVRYGNSFSRPDDSPYDRAMFGIAGYQCTGILLVAVIGSIIS